MTPYERLVDCIQTRGGEITLADDDLIRAATEAVECGHITTARLALREYAERQESEREAA